MPKDKRLFMTFPIDFADHPKVARLSDAAFRAFVEMNGYCRQQDTDGHIDVIVAKRRWKAKSIKELLDSDPERPLLLEHGQRYVLRSYADHQETRESREARLERNRANGAKGGRPRATETHSVTDSETHSVIKRADLGTQEKAESRVKSQETDLTDIKNLPESSHLSDARASDIDQRKVLSGMQARAMLRAEQAGVRDLHAVRDVLETTTLERLTLGAALELIEVILARAASPVRNADAYVATVCRTTPEEVREIATQIDVEAIA